MYLSSLQHLELCPVHGMLLGLLSEWISGHKNIIYLFKQKIGGDSSLCESDEQISLSEENQQAGTQIQAFPLYCF